MRVFEILKFFKALVAAEFQGLCEALPPAIEAYREAFVATAKYCANGFTCSDVAVRTRIKRHSFRSAPYRSRQRSAVVTPRRREDSADEDWLFPHLRHRRTRTSLVASFLESITPSNMMREIHVDEYLAEEDYVTKSSSCLSSFVSDDEDAETEEEDEEEDPVPPLLDVDEDDWDAFIPKVATITVDICVATTSESTTEKPEVPASTEDEGVSQPQADEGPEASLPSDDLSFECFGAHGPITTNVSYRQLTQEHAPAEGEAFYRVALQRLKLERQLRRRLRSSSEAWSITSSTSESANVQQLPTETKADDEAARARREKLALLRRQRTGFEIRVGYLKETSEVAEYAECGPDHSRSSTMSEEADAVAEAPLVAYV